MKQDSGWHPMLDYLSTRANRPFGDAEARSGRLLQSFSFAGQQAADNLLVKARRALDHQDHERARAMVERAVRLPYDEHEAAAPAALAVHMDLFGAVTDALEQADEHDSRWLDAALSVLADADQRAGCDLRDVLVAIDHDYRLSRREHRRIQAAIAAIPDRAELRDLELTSTELRDHVLAILEARRAYDAALSALSGHQQRSAPA